jgi:hypothetical protein
MILRPIASLLAACLAFCIATSPARADVVISEFVANNNTGLADEDGDREDWIELYNNGTTVESLAGWRLTDNQGNPTKWILPAVNIEPRGFVIVFASNKDRSNPASQLHTNFKLSAAGGYLALIRPNGTIATEFNPYPAQYDDKPYGFGQTVGTTTLIGSSASLRYLVPTTSTPTNSEWTAPAFNANAWPTGTNGVGFETTVPGWALRTFFSGSNIDTIGQAENVISTPALQTSSSQVNHPVINFDNSSSAGHYTPENPPPALVAPNLERFVVEGTGIITIPTAGNWTFCVTSDDGGMVQIRPIGGATYTTAALFGGLRGMGDSVGVYNFPSAGQYEIRAVVFENAGGAGGEISARAGSTASWDSSFRLIGDTAAGGLAIQSIPTGTSNSGFAPFIATSLKTAMYDASPRKTSAYVRYTFTNPGNLTSLSLPIRYDDGVAIYLNGTQVATRNAPGTLTNTSVATADRPASQAVQAEVIDLTAHLNLLTAGNNVLAVHGLNDSLTSGDFLVKAELYQYTVTTQPSPAFYTTATPGAFNTTAIYNKVAPVVASVERGFFSSAQNVTLSTGTPSAVIRYSFDGSTPTESSVTSATYTGPIPINKTTTLRYRAFKTGADPSDVGTQTYIFPADVITQSPTGAPPVITNPTGATQTTTAWPGAPSGSKYAINGQELDFGMDPDVVNNPTYSSTIQDDLKAIPTFSIVTDLAHLFDSATGIYVNPQGDGLPWERPTSLELINPDGTVGFQVNCGLRLRGGYSRDATNPKHSFRLLFRDSYGPSRLVYPLFGADPTGATEFDRFDLRTAQNYSWSFAGDGNGHFLQDPFARDQQIAMGHPSSHGGFYHLYINGHYWGIFNIDERPEANFGATYFGGSPENFDAVKTDRDLGYSIEATDGNLDAWTQLWQLADSGLSPTNTEAANNATYQRMLGRNPDGSVNPAYPVLFDAVNTIDTMLIVYWGGNTDAQISDFLQNDDPNNAYFMRDRTGASGGFKSILHDSEHTLLSASINRLGPWPAGNSNGSAGLSKSTPQYIFQQCIYSSEFRALVADRVYRHCYNDGVLTPARALSMFNARAAEIDRAIVAESARWGDSKTNGNPPFTRANWLNACNAPRNFISARTPILINQLRTAGWYPTFDPPVFSLRGGTVTSGASVTLTLAPGTPGGSVIYYTTDGSDPRAFGGGVAGTAQSIASGGSLPITTSRIIRVRTRNGTTWSALDEVVFYVQQDYSPLAVTEINYAPLPSTPGGLDGGDYEFIELKNTGANPLDLGGLSFDAGLTYTFPTPTSLPPGQFIVLVKNLAKFQQRYPGVTARQITSGSLQNDGERITLIAPQGGTVLSVRYDDDNPWPGAADGSGFTAVPASTVYNSDNGLDWRASAAIHGSPGADDPAVNFPPVLIHEALANSVLPIRDTIELHNPTSSPVTIGDWWLTDDRDTPQKYRIPSGTTIPANGFIAFDESQFNPTPGAATSFALGANGDDVYLFGGDVNGNLTGYSHGWSFAASEPGVSHGTHTNSVGDKHFVRQSTTTFGAPNAGPLVGPLVINEVMYNPYPGYDEFIELRNLTASPVSLDGPSGTTWKIGGISYNFPTGQSIAANGYALVVAIEPTAFRTKYNIPAAVPIFGPFAGQLQDSGERLTLEKPDAPYVDNQGVLTTPYILIEAVRYNDKAPWPLAADGEGPSLQRLSSSTYGDDPINWAANGATPGASNSANQVPSVVLTGPENNSNYMTGNSVNFTAAASDPDGSVLKVEFYVDGIKVGEDSTSPYAFAWVATGGIHTCRAVAIDNALGVRQSDAITILVTTPVSQGLKAEYYANRALTAPVAFIRTDATVNFTDGGGAWVNTGGVGTDNFSVRWSGQIRPAFSGTYTFYTMSDDGVRLWVNDQSLVNNWTDHGPTENSGTINLTAGQFYTVTMEYYEAGGGATAQLSWSGPNVGKQIIPQSVLYPDSAPIIVGHPTNVAVEAGVNANFTVQASGLNNQYQWRRSGVNIPGANGATLQLSPAIVGDAGQYTCIVSNSFGFAISNAATLTVSFTDTDGDGMQNSWETANGFNISNAGDANLDRDGDGLTNLQEFQSGTDPRNSTDYLRSSITKTATGWKITFTAQNRKSYAIQYKPTLIGGTWVTLQSYPEQPGVRQIEYTDTSTNGTRFYRVATPSP